MNDNEVLQDYFSQRGKNAVASLWSKLDKEQRRERMALPLYIRKVRIHGQETADRWLMEKFGDEKALTMITSEKFQNQLK